MKPIWLLLFYNPEDRKYKKYSSSQLHQVRLFIDKSNEEIFVLSFSFLEEFYSKRSFRIERKNSFKHHILGDVQRHLFGYFCQILFLAGNVLSMNKLPWEIYRQWVWSPTILLRTKDISHLKFFSHYLLLLFTHLHFLFKRMQTVWNNIFTSKYSLRRILLTFMLKMMRFLSLWKSGDGRVRSQEECEECLPWELRNLPYLTD